MLCDNHRGWGGAEDEREVQEGGDIRVPVLIHVDVWQKQHNL